MRTILLLTVVVFFATSCGEKTKKKEEGFEVSRTKTEEKKADQGKGAPIDLDNKGIGPIKELTFEDEIDAEMAARGEAKFNTICSACHMTDQRFIGPAMTGLYKRRSPEWVMNMMLNPAEMLQKDPIAKALYKEYGSIMQNQGLTPEEARDIAEYLRTL